MSGSQAPRDQSISSENASLAQLGVNVVSPATSQGTTQDSWKYGSRYPVVDTTSFGLTTNMSSGLSSQLGTGIGEQPVPREQRLDSAFSRTSRYRAECAGSQKMQKETYIKELKTKGKREENHILQRGACGESSYTRNPWSPPQVPDTGDPDTTSLSQADSSSLQGFRSMNIGRVNNLIITMSGEGDQTSPACKTSQGIASPRPTIPKEIVPPSGASGRRIGTTSHSSSSFSSAPTGRLKERRQVPSDIHHMEQSVADTCDGNETIRLVLVGKAGCGKSSTGNTILGEKKFATSLFMPSETYMCQLERTNHEGTIIEVLDSPGLFDTSMSHEMVARCLIRNAAAMHPGPHAILYVVKIGSRYTEEEFNTYQRLKTYFGQDKVKPYFLILFTHGDALEREHCSVDEYLRHTTEEFTKVLKECGGRYVVFDNTATNRSSQVDNLLSAVRSMIRRNRGRHYESPLSSKIKPFIEREIAKAVQASEEREMESNPFVQRVKKERDEARREQRQTSREMKNLQKSVDKNRSERDFVENTRATQSSWASNQQTHSYANAASGDITNSVSFSSPTYHLDSTQQFQAQPYTSAAYASVAYSVMPPSLPPVPDKNIQTDHTSFAAYQPTQPYSSTGTPVPSYSTPSVSEAAPSANPDVSTDVSQSDPSFQTRRAAASGANPQFEASTLAKLAKASGYTLGGAAMGFGAGSLAALAGGAAAGSTFGPIGGVIGAVVGFVKWLTE